MEDEILDRVTLEAWIERQNPILRDILRLYIQGYMFVDIAELLGISRSTVWTHVKRAGLSGLRNFIGRYSGRTYSSDARLTKFISNKPLNDDPEWVAYVESLEPLIKRIVRKYTQDESLREDCAQVARIALLQVRPENIKTNIKSFCGNVIRNKTFSYLSSPNTGSWATVRDGRFESLDHLCDLGMDVDTDGNVTWDTTNQVSDGGDE